MTNLERLKGSGLLIRGLEEFLATRLGDVFSNETPLSFQGETRRIFQALPTELQDFYGIAHRWLWDFGGGCFRLDSTHCLLKPSYANIALETRPLTWKKTNGLVEILYHKTSQSTVALSLRDPIQLVTQDTDFAQHWHPLRIPLDEFLVTTALFEMITWAERLELKSQKNLGDTKRKREEKSGDALLLFSGRHLKGKTYHYFQNEEGQIWILDDHEQPLHSCRPDSIRV